MCAFDTAASQHAADEDNRHATLARTQLTATKARTQGSVDKSADATPIDEGVAHGPHARASGHPPITASKEKSKNRDPDRKAHRG